MEDDEAWRFELDNKKEPDLVNVLNSTSSLLKSLRSSFRLDDILND